MNCQSDYLILGSGLAGLKLALSVATQHSVIIVTKKEANESNTQYAQGGIASVWNEQDDFNSHIEDTLVAGAGLCKKEIVQQVVFKAPQEIKKLIDWGVRFSKNNSGHFDLGQEGGHSQRRILHAGDITGSEIERALLKQVLSHPNIQVFEQHIAIDLITSKKRKISQDQENRVLGAYVLDRRSGEVKTFASKVVVLASGGAGKVYLYTSNPDIATGDGIAMAWRAGVSVGNMEFVQFHPTCLYHPQAKSFLISEALRGEGAILKLKSGEAFMHRYHPLKDLAPRDIVARAIDTELKSLGHDAVYLDISHQSKDFLIKRFPNIYETCLKYGFDLSKEAIPVVPAAHYFCGGVLVNHQGATSLKGLYACGEVAYTGLHGANRLASNSLLEAAVYSSEVAESSIQYLQHEAPLNQELPTWNSGQSSNPDEQVIITHNWDEIRRTMWNYVGILRSNKRLLRAKKRMEFLQEEIREYYWNFKIHADLIELRNLNLVSQLIIESALTRKESRGLHSTIDYPETLPQAKETILNPRDYPWIG